MDVLGYKAFYKGLINNYGMKFSVGKIYFMPGVIKFGLNGNGFHMCKNIEDTFRYFNTFDYDIDICEVKGSLDVCEGKDEYYGYYDMYSVKLIEILKKLTRDEIISLGLNLDEIRAERFVSTYRLNKDEIELFKQKYKCKKNVLNALSYYQEKIFDIYNSNI